MAWTEEQRAKARARYAARRAKLQSRSTEKEPYVALSSELESPEQGDGDASFAKVQAAIEAAAQAGTSAPDPNRPETIPVNLFSGQARRLEFHDQKPGFTYWWCNDDKGGTTISRALQSGWKFTERKDVKLNAAVTPRNNALGSYVRQHVGTDEAGQPMYAYLMEKPEWLHKLHEEGPGSREEYHQSLLKQIREGTMGQKAGEHRISANRPHEGTSAGFLPKISIDTKFVR
jgi:hypothetical protein